MSTSCCRVGIARRAVQLGCCVRRDRWLTLHLRRGDRFGDAAALFGHRRVDRQRHRHAPAAVAAGFDEPVRLDDDRLMHQLEAAFRLADRFDRERPDVHRPVDLQLDVDAEPLVGQAQLVDVVQIEPRAELAERVAAARRGSSGRRRRRAGRRS